MTTWMYRLFIVGLAFFSATPVTQPNKDDQPGVLNVHIRDYCDPVTFAAIGCVRTVTPVSAGVITFSGFQAELGADKSVGAWRFVPDRAATKRASASCFRISEVKHTRLPACKNSAAGSSLL